MKTFEEDIYIGAHFEIDEIIYIKRHAAVG